jgi:hypothetical protein
MYERRKHKESYELAKSHMRGLMLEGINSDISPVANADYLTALRSRIPQQSAL